MAHQLNMQLHGDHQRRKPSPCGGSTAGARPAGIRCLTYCTTVYSTIRTILHRHCIYTFVIQQNVQDTTHEVRWASPSPLASVLELPQVSCHLRMHWERLYVYVCTCTDCIGSPQSMILLIFTYIRSTYIYTPTFHVYLFKPTYPSRYIYIYNLYIFYICIYI